MQSAQKKDVFAGSYSVPVMLFVALVILFVILGLGAAFLLNDQFNLLAVNSQSTAWMQNFEQTSRRLIIVVGLGLLGLLVALAMLWLVIRRDLEARQQQIDTLRKESARLDQQLKGRAVELAEERTQSRTILQSMNEGVVLLDAKTIQYVNRAFSRLVGYEATELVKQPLSDDAALPLARDLNKVRGQVAQAIAKGGVWQGMFTFQQKDGKGLETAIVGMPLLESDGRDGSIVLLVRDSSMERKLEEQKAAFVSNASHELRTPLANLRTRLYLLRKQPEKLDEHLAVMDDVTAFMQQLIDEMIDVGRFERGLVLLERENAVLQDLANEAVKNYLPRAERRSIKLTAEVENDPIKVLVDHKRIVQVFGNLIASAMNHTPQNGQVDVRVKIDPSSNGRPLAAVEVQDNGMGLSEEMLAQIFQPFASASQGVVSGTVLGLTLAKEIVELHGGKISAESAEGKGTRFSVRLPVLDT
ncbi:MAG: PAS domain S-box protein [Anaerolineae bacterium]|nr:PAS domain S-box protein [Anaerolineae bacterium]